MKKNDGKNAKANEKTPARLLLKKETIRILTADQLKSVHGGHDQEEGPGGSRDPGRRRS